MVAPQAALDAIAAEPTAPLPPGSAPVLVVAQSLIGVAFIVAALLAHRSYRRSGRAGDALLAAGFLIAAFSQVHYAIHPGSYTVDRDHRGPAAPRVLRRPARRDRRRQSRRSRRAPGGRRWKSVASPRPSSPPPRSRSAPASPARSTTAWRRTCGTRSSSRAGWPRSRRSRRAETALGRGRDAIDAPSPRRATRSPRCAAGPRAARCSTSSSARWTTSPTGSPSAPSSPRRTGAGDRAAAQAEVLRIVQEALTNVRKHADATVVRVSVASGDDLRIAVVDNGRGFRPDAVDGGFGLDSMRQRAELIGATLSITSKPRDGSRVELCCRSPGRGGPVEGETADPRPAGRRPRARALGDPPGARCARHRGRGRGAQRRGGARARAAAAAGPAATRHRPAGDERHRGGARARAAAARHPDRDAHRVDRSARPARGDAPRRRGLPHEGPDRRGAAPRGPRPSARRPGDVAPARGPGRRALQRGGAGGVSGRRRRAC